MKEVKMLHTSSTNSCAVPGKRKSLDVKVTREELDSMKLLNTNLSCADQSLDTVMLSRDKFGEKNDYKDFVSAVLERKAEVLFLQEQWWDEVLKKYGLIEHKLDSENPVYIDFVTGELYLME